MFRSSRIERQARLFLLGLVTLGASGTTRADIVAATFTSGLTTVGHAQNNATTLGWVFTANSDLIVTALGYYDDAADGLFEDHEVGIFDSGGNLLFSATVPSGTSESLVDQFRFIPIVPQALPAGEYTIGGTIGANATDPVTYRVSGLITIPEITIPTLYASRYTLAGSYTSLSFPDLNFHSEYMYFGPNFQISVVPEPSSLIMMGSVSLCFLLWRWRGVSGNQRLS